MANESVSREQVKRIVNSLECSPSKNDSSGNYGGKPSLSPQNSEATSSSEKTSAFQMTDRGKTLPHYRSRFAKKASQA